MGRFANLCGDLAAEAEDGPDGTLVLPTEVFEKLRHDWSDEDIEDALGFVRDSLLQSELVEAIDSLSARLVELLGGWGDERSWAVAAAGQAILPVEVIGQLARRVERVEEILEAYRDDKGPDRRGFDELRRRLMDQGIEEEMQSGRTETAGTGDEGEE